MCLIRQCSTFMSINSTAPANVLRGWTWRWYSPFHWWAVMIVVLFHDTHPVFLLKMLVYSAFPSLLTDTNEIRKVGMSSVFFRHILYCLSPTLLEIHTSLTPVALAVVLLPNQTGWGGLSLLKPSVLNHSACRTMLVVAPQSIIMVFPFCCGLDMRYE